MNVWRMAFLCAAVGVACGGSSGTDLTNPSSPNDGGGVPPGTPPPPPPGNPPGADGGSCAAGTADCDGNAANGCETNTQADDGHCGGCANPCASGSSCQAGKCVTGP